MPPPIQIECGSVLTVRQLLLGSDALTLLSPDQLAVELTAGVLVALPTPVPVTRTIGVTTRAEWRRLRRKPASWNSSARSVCNPNPREKLWAGRSIHFSVGGGHDRTGGDGYQARSDRFWRSRIDLCRCGRLERQVARVGHSPAALRCDGKRGRDCGGRGGGRGRNRITRGWICPDPHRRRRRRPSQRDQDDPLGDGQGDRGIDRGDDAGGACGGRGGRGAGLARRQRKGAKTIRR